MTSTNDKAQQLPQSYLTRALNEPRAGSVPRLTGLVESMQLSRSQVSNREQDASQMPSMKDDTTDNQSVRPDAYRQLERDSDIFTDLIETIKASTANADPEIFALLRKADSVEQLEKELQAFKSRQNSHGK